MTDDVFDTCRRWRNEIALSEVQGVRPNQFRAPSAPLIREYLEYRAGFQSLDITPRVCGSGSKDAVCPCITRSREFMSDWQKADPRGDQCSKGGHWPLKVIIDLEETGRDRGEKGKERLRVQRQKKNQWMLTNVWPWWIGSDTEAHHWSAQHKGRDVQGGQCDGLFWRHSRGEWLESGDPRAQEKLEAYELPWIEACGVQAMTDALRDTEDAYQASLSRGNTLKSLTEEAERKGAELAARKEEARRGSGQGEGSKRRRSDARP